VTRLRWITAPLVALLLGFAVACGGDSGDAATRNDPGSAGSSGGASAAASGLPRTEAGGGSTTTGTLNFASTASRLAEVESFRFNFNLALDLDTPEGATGSGPADFLTALLGDVRAEGAYVAPDTYEVSVDLMDETLQAVKAGDDVWVNDGSGWEPAGTGVIGPIGFSSPEDLLIGLIPAAELAGAETTSENVNGVDATRYSFDKESLASLAMELGVPVGFEDISEIETLALDVWVSGDGLPVKLQLDASGESEGTTASLGLEFNVTDLNDPGIAIELPAEVR
jgi:hypothetical protein